MKKIWIMALVVLLVLPLMADRTWNETFTTAFNLNASATKTHGTDFTSASVQVSSERGARMALLVLTFSRAAGSALTVDFYFQVSYDGTTWCDFNDPIADAEYFSLATNHAVTSGSIVLVARVIHLAGVSHIRLNKVVNNDTGNNVTAVNALLSY